tara:strand:+ start:3204 stop:3314 length:111 start_codon:yes stop_codon:yes gene_type:complete
MRSLGTPNKADQITLHNASLDGQMALQCTKVNDVEW